MKAHPLTDKCELCNGSLRRYKTFYDAKTRLGPWAWMCKNCFKIYGKDFGTGLGQEYNSKTDDKIRG